MRFRQATAWLLLTAAAVAGAAPALAQEYEGRQLVNVELLAAQDAAVPGKPLRVGLRVRMAEGWHTYWEFPGDSGLPTRIAWDLPEGFGAGPIEWPIPLALLEPGDLLVYAYKGETLLLTTIQVPADAEIGSTVELRAAASWLVCEEICIPGGADVSLALPVAADAGAANAEVFAEFEGRLPSADEPPFAVEWTRGASGWTLAFDAGGNNGDAEFFPLPSIDQRTGHPAVSRRGAGGFEIDVPMTGDARGVLAVTRSDGTREGWLVASGGPEVAVATGVPGGGGGDLPLWLTLVYGMLGGLILNLMPCVLPVISLKIFGFIRQAGESPRRIFLHGLAFVAGIFAWFMGLGAVVAGFKIAGGQATWAFQFQSPVFNLVVCAIIFVFALNLFGVFEVALPGKATGGLSELGGREGYGGSFFQGMFATLLATPCTGPFLGYALGFAFAQPPAVILVMFASVAFGMGFPYLVLSAKPGWMKFLPKPGPWMERLKQFMGFPLLATLLWLLYILGRQKGLEAVVWACAFFLCLGMSAWIYGAFCGPASPVRTRNVALVLAIAVSLGGGWMFLGGGFARASASDVVAAGAAGESTPDRIAWIPFSRAEVDRLLDDGRAVFIDFTADWCLTCKFNERAAIDRPAVRALVAERGIAMVMGDWTNSNPEITEALAEFGRVGVPFYLWYPDGRNAPPQTLPELLTEQLVLDTLSGAK